MPGTGCVHTAPGHGREDYETGLAYDLDVYSPVDDRGRFTSEVEYFAGQEVFEANRAVIEKLREKGALIKEQEISHEYPHCWRCKKPVIFRSTEQWFISMEKNDLRGKALAAIDRVSWIPAWGRDRIYGMIANRPDWCISRQRAWGVPITVFFCEDCGELLISQEIVDTCGKARGGRRGRCLVLEPDEQPACRQQPSAEPAAANGSKRRPTSWMSGLIPA